MRPDPEGWAFRIYTEALGHPWKVLGAGLVIAVLILAIGSMIAVLLILADIALDPENWKP